MVNIAVLHVTSMLLCCSRKTKRRSCGPSNVTFFAASPDLGSDSFSQSGAVRKWTFILKCFIEHPAGSLNKVVEQQNNQNISNLTHIVNSVGFKRLPGIWAPYLKNPGKMS